MKRFVEGEDRTQGVLLPEFLDDYVAEDNPVRAIDVFVDELDLRGLGFEGVVAETTGRPAYHPATMLKIYVYGYVNQIQSSRRLERETARNVEMMWLTGRLTPDFKTIADFRKDNGPATSSASSPRGSVSTFIPAMSESSSRNWASPTSVRGPVIQLKTSGPSRLSKKLPARAEGSCRRPARDDAG